MAEYIRDAYMQPRAVREALEGEFSAEVILEVYYAVDDYARHWDIHRTGDGFDTSNLSVPAKVAFKMVFKIITEYNSKYFERAYTNSNNAVSGWEKRKDNEEKNRKRREAYATKRAMEQAAASRVDFDLDTGVKHRYDKIGSGDVDKSEKSSTFRSDETAKKTNLDDTKTDTKVADATLSGKGDSENMRSHTRLLLTVTDSKESITEVVVTKEKGCGEKHFIHKPSVDNSDCSYPSGSLTGSKPLPASPEVGEESKAVRGSKAVKGKSKPAARTRSKAVGSRASDCQNKSDNRGRRKASSNDLRNKNSANSKLHGKNVVCRGWVHKDKSLVVDEAFKIDFLDPVFVPFNRADEFLIKGFEAWVRRELVGRRAEKKWLGRKFWVFICNQGKEDYFLKIWNGE